MSGGITQGAIFVGGNSPGGTIVLGGNCPRGNWSGGSCLGGNCPGGNSPRTSVINYLQYIIGIAAVSRRYKAKENLKLKLDKLLKSFNNFETYSQN